MNKKTLWILLAGMLIMPTACTPKKTEAATTAETSPVTEIATPTADLQTNRMTFAEYNGSGSSADFEMDGTTLVKYNGRESHVIIPSTVTVIGKNAFFDYSFIKGVTIPSSVTTIGENAFGRTELTSVTIPSSVTVIEHGAFQEIPGLKNIDIPSSVSTIGNYAFAFCDNLTSVTLSRGTETGDNTFDEGVQINYRD